MALVEALMGKFGELEWGEDGTGKGGEFLRPGGARQLFCEG